MIFKHNKNISRNFIVFYYLVFFLFSCGSGGGSGNSSSIAQPNPLTFWISSLPSSVESYDLTSLQVISSIDECKFQIDSEDFLWISSSDGKSFNIISFGADGIEGGEEKDADISLRKNK